MSHRVFQLCRGTLHESSGGIVGRRTRSSRSGAASTSDGREFGEARPGRGGGERHLGGQLMTEGGGAAHWRCFDS